MYANNSFNFKSRLILTSGIVDPGRMTQADTLVADPLTASTTTFFSVPQGIQSPREEKGKEKEAAPSTTPTTPTTLAGDSASTRSLFISEALPMSARGTRERSGGALQYKNRRKSDPPQFSIPIGPGALSGGVALRSIQSEGRAVRSSTVTNFPVSLLAESMSDEDLVLHILTSLGYTQVLSQPLN